MGKAKKTANRQAFEKEIKRIKKGISKARRQGFIISEEMVNAEKILQAPERITKQRIEKLKAIKPSDIYRKGSYQYTTTSEFGTEQIRLVSAEEGIKIRKEEAKKKRKQAQEKKKELEYLTIRSRRFFNELTGEFVESDKYVIQGNNIVDADTGEIVKTIEPIKPVPSTSGTGEEGEAYDTDGSRMADTSIIGTVKSMIDSLPDFRHLWNGRGNSIFVDFTEAKQQMISNLNDMIGEVGDEAVAEYLKANINDLNEAFDGAEYDSKSKKVEGFLYEAIDILEGDRATLQYLASLQDMNEGM